MLMKVSHLAIAGFSVMLALVCLLFYVIVEYIIGPFGIGVPGG
mgnify:CR=1 FL=1